MADTQVDSGSDISAKVRTLCTRRDPPLTRILPKPPQVRAYLRSVYWIRSVRMFGNHSPTRIFKGIVLWKVLIAP